MAIENSAGDFGFGPPQEHIDAGIAQGQKWHQQQRFGRPQYGFPDISQDQVDKDRLLNALLGAGAGANATNGAAHPLAALAMGLAGGIGAPQAGDMRAKRQMAQYQLQEQQNKLAEDQLNQTPIEHISPKIVQAYPELAGVPMGVIQKITPLLQTQEKTRQAQIMFQQNAQLRRELSVASPAMQAIAESMFGFPPGSLVSLKTAEVAGLKDQGAKPLSAELLKLKENATDGVNSLQNALAIFDKSGQMTKTAAAYGGVGSDVFRAMVGADSQELRRELLKATDVVTRIRTGAALNQSEQVFYNGLVTKVLQTNGQNRKSMEDLLNFYQKISSDIDSGKRTSGINAIASDPKKLAQLASRLHINPKIIDVNSLVAAPAAQQGGGNDPLGIR